MDSWLKMNDAQIKAKLRIGKPGRYCVDKGLYLRISNEGTGFWVLRYTVNARRREHIISRYGTHPEGLPLVDAKARAAILRADIKKGIDPIAESKRPALSKFRTVDDIANDWLSQCEKRVKHPNIPKRVYLKEISPRIGELSLDRVTARDILGLIRDIKNTNRPSIANDALGYCKQIFKHAVKLDLISNNPALAFDCLDAGGTEKARDRILSISELEIILKVFRDNHHIFTRENYIAFVLLAILGVRKGELIAAQWKEFDFTNLTWKIPSQRTKTESGYTVPIPTSIRSFLEELAFRANGADFVFPARKASKRRQFISDDTLNHALAKLFGQKVDAKKKPYPNILGQAGIEHFVIHDLRRTCRSLLAANGVPPHIAERCLNHKIKGVEGIYDHHDYLNERREAISTVAKKIMAIA